MLGLLGRTIIKEVALKAIEKAKDNNVNKDNKQNNKKDNNKNKDKE